MDTYVWGWHGFDNLWDGFLDFSLSGGLDFVLLFLLIFAVAFGVLSAKFFKKQNKGIVAIIAVSVGILSTWYLSYEGIDLQIFTYNAFALFFTAGIALFIMLYFIHKFNFIPGFRRALILLYGVILFIALSNQSNRFLGGYFDLALIITIILLIIFDKSINDHITSKSVKHLGSSHD